ncbi:MAG: exonuclease [Thermodesulfobacteriota bacterium]|nr:exonuclease [Thermodesulfobacteriota bacterium]
MDFIVIDTEGLEYISQLAIIDSSGSVIYEAFVKESINEINHGINIKPLKTILKEFIKTARFKLIICHYAKHDIKVLKKSFKMANLEWPDLKFDCSYELSKMHCKDLVSYSLEYLTSFFDLKVHGRYFNPNFAHSARYDALFTYELYQRIREKKMPKINPFASNRVDNPFQTHLDVSSIYSKEFNLLETSMNEIKLDSNHQSSGLVVLGEPGTGKTHLMMRLARKNLKSNRLFFIRQPNNPDFILYHIYSRMLESFVENVPGTNYSQLEYLLAKSFAKITIKTLEQKKSVTKKDKSFIESLSKDSLNLYSMMGGDGTQTKRNNWQFIENKLIDWWGKRHGLSEYSENIIKGLIKFCSYSDQKKKELVRKWLSAHDMEESELSSIGLINWNEDISKEDFSFEAIKLFGKLSLEDEPLIIIFDQLEGLKYDDELLINFGQAVKELMTHIPNSLFILNLFPDRWDYFKTFFDDSVTGRFKNVTSLNHPSRAGLKAILTSKAKEQAIDIDELFTKKELKIILDQTSIREVLNSASEYYQYKINGVPLSSKFKTFEENVSDKLTKMQNDINLLKQTLKIDSENNQAPSDPAFFLSDYKDIIEYLNRQQQLLEKEYHSKEIINSTHDIGKFRTIITMYKQINNKVEIDRLMLGKKKLPEHLQIKIKKLSYVVSFLHESGISFTTRIKNFNQLVINYDKLQFRLFRDIRESEIKAKVGKEEIAKLNNAKNGKFLIMDKKNRIVFELIYKVIVDIQNKDLNFHPDDAFKALKTTFKDHWVIALLK